MPLPLHLCVLRIVVRARTRASDLWPPPKPHASRPPPNLRTGLLGPFLRFPVNLFALPHDILLRVTIKTTLVVLDTGGSLAEAHGVRKRFGCTGHPHRMTLGVIC